MPGEDYDIFDLHLERQGDGYRARVLASPAGHPFADLHQAISEDQLASAPSPPERLGRI